MLRDEVRLRHVESARVPTRHAATSPPQLSDSLHRSAWEQRHRPPDFLSGHPHEVGKWERPLDYAREADDTVHGICGAHAGHETTELRETEELGAERFMVNWIALEASRAGLRYAVVYVRT